MRSLAIAALLFMAGCHRSAPSTPTQVVHPNENHPCDLNEPERMPVSPKFAAYSATELDQNEQALLADKGCHLAIAPMAPLPTDDVILSDCTELADSYASAKRSECRHACIVDARQAAAVEAFTRAVVGLGYIGLKMDGGHDAIIDACAGQYGSAGSGVTTKTDTVDGKHYWACIQLHPLPPAFTVIVEHAHGLPPRLVSVEITGTMPALPPHTWKLSSQDDGCGFSRWGVQQISPWPVAK